MDMKEMHGTEEEAISRVKMIRERNEKMEHEPILPNKHEAEAEALYSEIKLCIASFSEQSTEYLWLKLLWYSEWCAPNDIKNKVRASSSMDAGNGMVYAHVPRPAWIRPPEGGDAFDRGEVSERTRVPL